MYQEPYQSNFQPSYFVPPTPELDRDIEHLRKLTIGHYVSGAVTMVFSCIPIIHLVIGLKIVLDPPSGPGRGGAPFDIGWFFVIIASVIILFGWSVGAATIYAGRLIARRQKHTFCLVVAALNCVFSSPLGLILAIFTFIVLLRESVKQLFNGGSPVYPTAPPPPPGSIYQ